MTIAEKRTRCYHCAKGKVVVGCPKQWARALECGIIPLSSSPLLLLYLLYDNTSLSLLCFKHSLNLSGSLGAFCKVFIWRSKRFSVTGLFIILRLALLPPLQVLYYITMLRIRQLLDSPYMSADNCLSCWISDWIDQTYNRNNKTMRGYNQPSSERGGVFSPCWNEFVNIGLGSYIHISPLCNNNTLQVIVNRRKEGVKYLAKLI